MSSNSINGIEDEQIYHFLPKAVRDGGFARAYNPIIPGERGIPMGNAHEYLMPDYYPDFHCKTGMCRAACCVGWNVSLSMQDYFRLLGVECRKHVREKLDCALHVKRYPTEDSYAELVHRYDGNCPLRMESGLCAIHAEADRRCLRSAACIRAPFAPRETLNAPAPAAASAWWKCFWIPGGRCALSAGALRRTRRRARGAACFLRRYRANRKFA